MTRALIGAAVVAGFMALVVTLDTTRAEEKKDPSIKEIMTKAHKGADSLIGKLGKELKADTLDWDLIQKQTKELAEMGMSLSKATPPQGDKESWEKLTKVYVANSKEMVASADKKDKDTTAADVMKVTMMCGNCHKVHKPK